MDKIPQALKLSNYISTMHRPLKELLGLQALIGEIFSVHRISHERRILLNKLKFLPYALAAIALIYHETFGENLVKYADYYETLLYPSMKQKNLCCAQRLLKCICEYTQESKEPHLTSFKENMQTVCLPFWFLNLK